MTTPKLLTRDELLELATNYKNSPGIQKLARHLAALQDGARCTHEGIGLPGCGICDPGARTVAALLPADGALPPIDNADEQIVDALVAKAQEGRTSRLLTPRQVTQTIEDLREAVRSQLQRERDAAIARAEAAEKRVAELERVLPVRARRHRARGGQRLS